MPKLDLQVLACCDRLVLRIRWIRTDSTIGNNELNRELWNNSLKGGLKSIQGKRTTLNDYFDVQMIKKNGKFVWEDIEFHIVQSVHIMDEYAIVPTFGLMIIIALYIQNMYLLQMEICTLIKMLISILGYFNEE